MDPVTLRVTAESSAWARTVGAAVGDAEGEAVGGGAVGGGAVGGGVVGVSVWSNFLLCTSIGSCRSVQVPTGV
jgi:hypothetical protein